MSSLHLHSPFSSTPSNLASAPTIPQIIFVLIANDLYIASSHSLMSALYLIKAPNDLSPCTAAPLYLLFSSLPMYFMFSSYLTSYSSHFLSWLPSHTCLGLSYTWALHCSFPGVTIYSLAKSYLSSTPVLWSTISNCSLIFSV